MKLIILLSIIVADDNFNQGERVEVLLKTGAMMHGYIITSKPNAKTITLIFNEEKVSGSLTISKKEIREIVKFKGQPIDIKLVNDKRSQFLKKTENALKQKEEEKKKAKEHDTNIKETQKPDDKTEETTVKEPDKGAELLNKFPPENGYGQARYDEYNKYWLKTGSNPPYLDLRTKAPPPQNEIEFFDNYSLWKYAFDKANASKNEQKK
ncbi:MAG: hypothetical protein HY606_04215 [Planctomycetes bacterium]|nr:hypothetical protein [Planctomycetota bacterium]